MKTEALRPQYLRFVSRLYDLAAEFAGEDLDHIRAAAEHQHASPIAAAAEAVSRLARGGGRQTLGKTIEPPSQNTGPSNGSSLGDLLSSKELFKSNDALAAFLAPNLKVRPRTKESRERLVSRVLAQLEQVPQDVRIATEKALANIVVRSGNSTFVARWSKLIRDL